MNQRLIYFDNMRAILMLLVIISHAACVFATKDYWYVIRSSDYTFLSDILFLAGQAFKMGAFFIISGYFAMSSLEKYSSSTFIKKRIYRIGIPLIVVAITFNSLQEYILIKTGWVDEFNLYTYIVNGEWKHHLWFLINLIVYFVLALIVKKNIFTIDKNIEKWTSQTSIIFILFILPLFTVILLVIAKIYPIRGIINSSNILMFLPFFTIGLFLKNNKELMSKFETIPIYISLSIVIVNIYFVDSYTGILQGNMWLSLLLYSNFLAKWFSVSLFFNLSKKYLNKRSVILDYLRESSYSMYLVHHVWIVIFTLFLIKLEIGGVLGLLLLIISTMLTSLVIYKWIVSKNDTVYFLLNGTKNTKSSLNS